MARIVREVVYRKVLGANNKVMGRQRGEDEKSAEVAHVKWMIGGI